MPDTDEIHQLFRSEEDFESFLAKVNDQGSSYEVFTATEGIGRQTDLELEIETIDQIDHFMLGWMRLVWEAHQMQPKYGEEDPDQSDDEPGLIELLFFPQQ